MPTLVAATPQEVEATAGELLEHAPLSLAVKVLSEEHVAQIGRWRRAPWALQSPADAAGGCRGHQGAAWPKSRPDARLEGFTVQPMIVRPNAHELLLGVFKEVGLFGPVILFGAGGVATEVVRDKCGRASRRSTSSSPAISCAQTRVLNLLKGYRDRPPANLEAIADALVRLSQLVVDIPGVA